MTALQQQVRGNQEKCLSSRGFQVDKREGQAWLLCLCPCTNEQLMEHFISVLQVQFRGLFQMILVLGIGGSFPYGFHISVINYPSVVSSPLFQLGNTKR